MATVVVPHEESRSQTGTRMRQEYHGDASEIVSTLCEAGAKLVCIDFDATFVSIHTSGAWSKTAKELRPYVRGLFLALVPLMDQARIHVALVTFSPQVDLIRAVLALCFPGDVTDRIIVRCDDPSWALDQSETIEFVPAWQVCGMYFDRKYKLPYLISAARQASKVRGELIRNRDTVLIDDDAKNIRIAIDNGITGIYYEPDGADPKELCRRIRKLHPPPVQAAVTAAAAASASTHTNTNCTLVQTPRKRTAIRLLQTPEPPAHRTTSRAPPSVRLQGTPLMASMSRTKKFSHCTPSPVMKLKNTVEMGRPRSKRAIRLRQCPRNIEDDMHELHMIQESESPGSTTTMTMTTATTTITSTVSRPPPIPFASMSTASPRSPDGKYGSFLFPPFEES